MSRLKKFLLFSLLFFCFIAGAIGLWIWLYFIPNFAPESATNALHSMTPLEKAIADSCYYYSQDAMLNHSELAIAIIDGDSTFYYGIERKNGSLHWKENSDSLFQIGSISKVFTSRILATEVVENRMCLDSPIHYYLGYPLKDDLQITLQSLSNHTSGLPRLEGSRWTNLISNFKSQPYAKNDSAWMENYLHHEISVDSLTKGHSNYSNLGVAILGYTMSKHAKIPYEELLQTSVLDELGMKNTFVYSPKFSNKVTQSRVENSINELWNLNMYSPAGGIASNLQDMTLFARASMDTSDPVSKLMQQTTYIKDSIYSLGLGWFLIHSRIKHKLLFHNGSTGYHTSTMVLDLDSKKGVIILSNTRINYLHGYLDVIAFSILRYLNNLL